MRARVPLKKDDPFQRLFGIRGIIALVLTILVILAWSGLSTIVRILAVTYLVYRVIRLVTHSLTCPVCLFHLLVAFLVTLIAFGLTSPAMIIGVIAIIWIQALKGPRKHGQPI